MKTPRINWEKVKDELLDLKFNQKKSLTEINRHLFDKYGKGFSNARISQVFTGWKNNEPRTADAPLAQEELRQVDVAAG